ncbi:transcription repressor NadR [Metabacillus fastidiosus]|uniref:transcription repressor NadR n=1 Tax=Metabacillus fastidiosus TaxID=1458 RepID=UPI003D29E6D5
MRMKDEKILGEERRLFILNSLLKADSPITGGELASRANVSRQVIVQDISLLKAKNEPIIATSQGYLYLKTDAVKEQFFEKIIACNHAPEKTKEELYTIVDHGVKVKNVIIEHSVYGDLTASIMVSNRREVDEFLKKIKTANAGYLSRLTDGLHLHTLVADDLEKIQNACKELGEKGFIIT